MSKQRSIVGLMTVAAMMLGTVTLSIDLLARTAMAAGDMAMLPTDNPANFTPNVLDGEVDSIFQIGTRVVITGTFTQLANATSNGGQVFSRTGIASFDATTGVVDAGFSPVVDGSQVTTIVPDADGTSIYIGGDFNTVNGATRRKIARLNLSDGSTFTAFNTVGVDGVVRDIRLVGGELVIAGLFATIAGQTRTALASLNPATGALDTRVNLAVTGTWNGGSTNIYKIDVTPSGDRLLMIGNFTSVGGLSRRQIALLDLTTTPASVSAWDTSFYTSSCSNSFDSYMRDLDISEDGSFAVVTTTGAYFAGTACDTDSRLELTTEAANITPTWVNYTGGDTSYAVEVHAGVAYLGGHMRWMNNPSAADSPGQGAVPRTGMAALDVLSGLPFSWNPTRERGVGLFDYHVTAAGLWAGSDTDRFHGELRQRLAFFPWAGGTTVPESTIGSLPATVVRLGATSGTTGADPSVLYRVNAAGPAVASVDDGPDWEADNIASSPYRNTGSNISTAGLTVGTVDATVPTGDFDRPPAALWRTERWDPAGGNEMQWSFPVTVGTPIEVRLYMGNKASSTANSGQRIFDVGLDGVTVVNSIDLAVDPGDNIGTMRAFDIVSDGSVDLDFSHDVENPLINGIEIVRTNVSTTGTLGTQDQVQRISYDGSSTPAAGPLTAGTVPWRAVRGAFTVNSELFTISVDSTLVRRTFDGTTFGAGTPTFTYANGISSEAASMTGIFFDPASARIYYTLSGQTSLYSRRFLPESGVVGATRTTISGGAVTTLDPTRVRGIFLAGGHLYVGDDTTGNLLQMDFSAGVLSGAITVADTTVDWRAQALFLTSPPPPPPTTTTTSTTTTTTTTTTSTTTTTTSTTTTTTSTTTTTTSTTTTVAPTTTSTSSTSSTTAPGATTSTSSTTPTTAPGTTTTSTPPPGSASGFTTVSPARVFDTRPGQSPDAMRDVARVKIGGDHVLQVRFTDLPGATPAGGVAAVSVNVAITNPEGDGFVTVFPCGIRELVANVNFVAGQTVSNAVIAPLSSAGDLCFYSLAPTDIIVDINGWLPTGSTFTPVAPARVFDTRPGSSPNALRDVARVQVGPTTPLQVRVVDLPGVTPATGVGAVSLNLAVTNTAAAGFVTVFPCGVRKEVASANYARRQTVSNAVIAPVSADGTICFYSLTPVDLVVDINGWFAAGAGFVAAGPERVLDTRPGQSPTALIDVPRVKVSSTSVLRVVVSGLAGVTPPTGSLSAVSLNVAVTNPEAAGFVTVFPCGTRNEVANVNYVAGQTVPNAVIAPVSAAGEVCFYSLVPVDLVVDINGWFPVAG